MRAFNRFNAPRGLMLACVLAFFQGKSMEESALSFTMVICSRLYCFDLRANFDVVIR